VGYSCNPGTEFTALGIPALFYRENGLDERVLKNIVSQIAVANHIKNVTEKGLFVPGEKHLKCTIIAFGVRNDQLLVGHRQKNLHY
jgi:wobble nucleotide-excising tRNase